MNNNTTASLAWESRKVLTLAFVENGDKILLGWKKRGFGQGLWNGFGGKVECGESIQEAAMREIKEECGLDVTELEQIGLIHFLYEGESVIHEVHIFSTSHFSGEVVESEEMRPMWWLKNELPFHQMWPDDRVWYPLLLKKEIFQGLFLFKGHTEILGYRIHTKDNKLLAEKNSDELVDIWPDIRHLPVTIRPPPSS